MKVIILALALLLFTSPVHANSIDGKAIFCAFGHLIYQSAQEALKNRTKNAKALASFFPTTKLLYNVVFEDGKANTYLFNEKNPDKIRLWYSSKYSVFPFEIKWRGLSRVGGVKLMNVLDRRTLVKKIKVIGGGTWDFYNCWLTTKDGIFEEYRLRGEAIKNEMKKNKL
jgi:hypothetical protein